MPEVPAIYVRQDGPRYANPWVRLTAFAIAISALAVLIMAAWLNPSPRGVGTHIQLGMQPCSFLQTTGIPCAGCGMTTSFAHLVRWHVVASFIAQPFGMILCLLTAVAFWSGLYVAITGKRSYQLLKTISPNTHLMIWLPLAMGGWAWKIALTVL